MEIPYISQIIVNDCYTYKNFAIPKQPLTEFKHIIVTGKNGSGKTTILRRVADHIAYYLNNKSNNGDPVAHFKSLIDHNRGHGSIPSWRDTLRDFQAINLKTLHGVIADLRRTEDDFIFSFFKAHRRVDLKEVKTVTQEVEFVSKLKANSVDEFTNQFKQYLVNKKVYEAFDHMNKKEDSLNYNRIFFENLTNTFRTIFKDPQLNLEFVQEKFEFFLVLSDSRRITFNQLSEGYSAFLSIIVDLIMRIDLIRKARNNYSLNPGGIVLIDEPETHFHLSMQYELLPLISALFPNIQLVIATHSPAIISSLKNAIVFDLSSQSEVSDWLLGSSYSELMIRHFGLDNEFSPFADNILSLVNSAIQQGDSEGLKIVLIQNEKYLTPALKLEIESQIIKLQNRQ